MSGKGNADAQRARKRRNAFGCGVAFAVCLLGGAGFVFLVSQGLLGASSRDYRPVSPREADVMANARRDLHPNDVRGNADAYEDTTVVWAGIIRGLELREEGDALLVRFEAEHRYFDWIEDNSVRREIYFPSSTGEGTFHAAWSMPLSSRAAVEANTHIGDMLIAYGQPAQHEERIGIYPCVYIRVIPRTLYDDTTLRYGRTESPAE